MYLLILIAAIGRSSLKLIQCLINVVAVMRGAVAVPYRAKATSRVPMLMALSRIVMAVTV